MAEDFAIGKALVIPQSVLNDITKLDDKINQIATDSENMASKFSTAITKMGGNVGELLAKLQNINNVINNIGSINAKGIDNVSKGIGNTATEAERAANSVTKVATSLNKVGNTDISKTLSSMVSELSKLNEDIKLYYSSIGTGKKTYIEFGQSGLKEASKRAEELMRSISALDEAQKRLNQNKNIFSDYIDNLNGVSLSAQRHSNELNKLNQYYKELEQSSARKAKEDEKATKAAERESLARQKAAEREAKSIANAEEQKRKEQERTYQAQVKLESKLRRSNYQSYVTSTEGSLRTADKANTYAQRAQAIKNLEAAIKKLRTTDANYQNDLKRLSDAHKRLSAEQKKVESNFRSIKGTQSNLMNTSDQLARKLALIFSVSQIEGYVNKLVRVRGEFELQNTALASILQNKDKADKLFGQITDLAVKSPFTLKELVTYTKSLSAYSVEYEKLYDTTKMLADVSSGLGVDMQRLILAFGQVKAANFLRGTETRQFTEAGINMLGELAKYYSELEGRIVSVNEVQDRQFKRMISFQDVEQVFKRLTSAGGMFYNMQERQAETIAGMMSNLQDRIDLMLNSIGKSNEGTIKGVIELLQSLLANYELVINMLKTAGAGFVAFKVYVLLAKDSLIQYAIANNIATAATTKQLTLLQLFNVGMLKLSTSIKSVGLAMKSFAVNNPYLLAFTAIATAIYEVIHWNDEYNEQISSINKKNIENAANLNKIVEVYEKIAKSARKAVDSQKDFSYSDETYKELYAQLSKLSESLKDRGYTMPIQIEFVTPQNIDEAFKGGKDILQLANDFSVEFGKAMASQTTATEGWFNVFGDNLSTDLQELSDAYGNVAGGFKANLDLIENEVINISSKLTGAAKSYYEELRAGQKDEESSTEWTLRRLDLLYKINQEVGVNLQEGRYKSMITNERTLIQLYRQRLDISNKEKEVQYELGKVVDELIKKYGSIENLKKVINKNPIVIKTEIDRYFEKEELDAQTKRFASHWLANKLQIPVEFTTPKALPTFFNDFRDTVKTLDVQGIFDKQLDSMSNLEELEGSLQKKYSENEKYLQTLNRSNTERLDLTKQIEEEQKKLTSYDADVVNAAKLKIQNLENQKSIIDKFIESEKERLKLENQSIVNIANSLNLSYKNEKKSTGENSELKRLKEQIDLIKKAGDEYEKLRKYYSEDEAKKRVVDAFREAFAEVGVSIDMDFDIDGIIKAIENLKNKAGEAGSKALKKEVATLETERDIKVQVKGLEEIQKQIDDVFSGYEFSLDLKTAGIDPTAFKNMIKAVGATDTELSMMGLDTTNFEDAQRKIRAIIEDLQKQGGAEQLSLAKKYQEQLTELEVKEAKKRFDELLTLREKYQSNEEKISKVQTDINTWQNELDEINKLGDAANSEQKELLEMRIQNGKDTILQLQSEALQLTDFWRTLFGDLEDLSVNSLRRLSGMVDEIVSSAKEVKGNKGQTVGYSATYTDKNGVEQQVTLTAEQYQRLLKQNNNVADEIEKKNPFIALFDAITKGKNEGESTLDYITRLEGILGSVSEAAFDVANNLADIFGADEDAKEMISNIQGLADGAISLGTGVARIASGDIIGGAMSAVKGISSIVTSINNIHDNKREREIERQTKLVDGLERAYNKLYDTIENGLSISMYSQNSALIKNLTAQIESYQAMIEAERDKKNTDYDRINEWENAIDDIYSQIGELYNNLKLDLVGDFKSVSEQLGDAIADAFENGTDAAEAWGESVKEIVADMVKNILVQKLIEPGVQQILDQMFESAMPKTSAASDIKEQIDNLHEQYNSLKPDSGSLHSMLDYQKRKEELENQINQLESQYQAALTAKEGEIPNITQDIIDNTLGQLESLGEDVLSNPAWGMLEDLLGSSSGDTMTGLEKGISSITENTAEVLASITESIRYFTSDSNTVLHNIYNLMINPPVENPFLSELKVQSEQLRLLYGLFNGIIKNVSGSGKAMSVRIV